MVPLRMLFFVGTLLLMLACGCSSGSKFVKAKGQLLLDGQPLRINAQATARLRFTLVDDNPSTYVAYANPDDATFAVLGKDGNGIPAGKYRITVEQKMAEPSDEIRRMNDLFQDGRAFVRDVANDDPMLLDLNKLDQQ